MRLAAAGRHAIRLTLTKAGKRLLAKKKTLGVKVLVRGVDGAWRKASKTVSARFQAPKHR